SVLPSLIPPPASPTPFPYTTLFRSTERGNLLAQRRFLEGYSPGKPVVTEFNNEAGVFIPAGHKLSMQFQYVGMGAEVRNVTQIRSEEHTSELQSREKLVCRLMLEKK